MSYFLQRELIIGLALTGAAIATLGSVLLRRKLSVDPRVARLILRVGYAITWGSIALFIIAGFTGE